MTHGIITLMTQSTLISVNHPHVIVIIHDQCLNKDDTSKNKKIKLHEIEKMKI